MKRHKVFYGWWVVAACSSAMLFTGGVIHFGFTAIFEPIAKEFGWSYAQVSFASSLRGIEVNIRPGEALASRTFWHIALAFAFYSLVIQAVVTHVMPYLSSVGINRTASGLIASAIPLASILGRLSFGWLGDRFNRKRLSTAGFAIMGFGLIFFEGAYSGQAWLLIPFLFFFGIGWGGNVTMRAALLRECFGRERFGTIYGFITGVMMLGSIAGAPVVGWVFDIRGSYQGVWFALAGLIMAAVVVVSTTPKISFKS